MKQVQSRPKTELVSATSAIEAQYSRADLRARITDALQAAGKDLDRLSINDLALMDEFHLGGRAATTAALADLAAIQAKDHLLDRPHRAPNLRAELPREDSHLLFNLEEQRRRMLQAVLTCE